MKKVLFILLLIFISWENENFDDQNPEIISIDKYQYEMSGKLEENSRERARNAVLEMTELIKVIRTDYDMV